MELENQTFVASRTPTIDKKDAGHVPLKYNFRETFDWRPFLGKIKEKLVKLKRKRTRCGGHTREIKVQTTTQNRSCLNPDFVRKHNITMHTKSHEYVNMVLPREKSVVNDEEY